MVPTAELPQGLVIGALLLSECLAAVRASQVTAVGCVSAKIPMLDSAGCAAAAEQWRLSSPGRATSSSSSLMALGKGPACSSQSAAGECPCNQSEASLSPDCVLPGGRAAECQRNLRAAGAGAGRGLEVLRAADARD